MPKRTLNSERAMAHGAFEAGVRVVTSYPGSPGAGVVAALASISKPAEVYLEWSTNEKVALEVGLGASLAGRRALVCTKSVGMNVLVDPLMVANITGVHAGLVVILGDDPGAYGSQNDQDTRPLAEFSEIPLLEPATPGEAKAMVEEAFRISELYRTVVIIRETRSFAACTESVDVADERPTPRDLAVAREPFRWVPYPANAVEKHAALHRKLDELSLWANRSSYNELSGSGQTGIVAAGFAYSKLLDVVGEAPRDVRLLKLGTLYPEASDVIVDFLQGVKQVLVFEENEPYVEMRIKALAHDHGKPARVLGKLTGHVPREGELFRWQIQETLQGFLEDWTPVKAFARDGESLERPFRKDNCVGSPAPQIVELIKEVGRELGIDPYLVGDPGCLVKAAGRLDAKFAMGSAIAVAHGLDKAGLKDRAVAIFGDSAFFHTALPALVNAVYNSASVLMIVLDNLATVTSGLQPNPGSGRTLRGDSTQPLSIERIAAACGVEFIRTIGQDDGEVSLRLAFREGLEMNGVGLIVVRRPHRPPA